ncbi:helix-turn-helix domain-containing protein [Pontixanthobacter aestiaquae]|uniref:AraC-like ligand-binding domain-containing protein n=1 Tax=Pontixanthobacter aestiaquae TaxID=1509367 RepID=UPI0025B451A0|nr:helix-turn-helix domain-containing protein [Pontixanthobacter aestiaquae]MDN3647213.1 helix-turn-helix domain-containing protein [Pontixanthobacter aestiaquae]
MNSQNRFAAWRESVSVIYDVEPYDNKTEERYFAHMDSMLLDDIIIMHCRLGAQIFNRSAERVARDGVDHYQLHVFRTGSAEMELGGRHVCAGTGTWVIQDHADTTRSEMTDYEVLNIFIPRRRLAPLLHTPDSMHGTVLAADVGAGRLLADYVVSLNAIAHDITRAQAPAAAEALTQLAALALNGVVYDTVDPPALANRALLLRAQVYIKDHLHLPNLSPDSIAGALGLSRARLYRIFAPCGGIADYIREIRLRRCYTDLISARHDHIHISQIAYRWGFKDASHFSKLFRSRFGVQPNELRGEVRAGMGGASVLQGLAGVDATYSSWIANLG